MIVGILLSDGNIEKRKGWNPRIRIEHSFKNFNYIWFVFNELSTLINTFPLLIKRKFKSKYFYSLAFRTRQLSCLNEMYDLFYDTNKKEKVSGAYAIKLIKYEIFYYINYISLAFWIMGDGSKRGRGLVLCTDSFSLKDIILLMNILKIKFDIDSTIEFLAYAPYSISLEDRKTILNNKKKIARIIINKKNLDKVREKIKPFFTKDFLYKIN